MPVKYKWLKVDCLAGRDRPYKIWHAVEDGSDYTLCKQHDIGEFKRSALKDWPGYPGSPKQVRVCKNCKVKIGGAAALK